MSNMRIMYRIRCIIICFCLLTAAWSQAAVISYTDKLNRTVEIPVPVQRAVFLQLYEMLPALDVWDKVVGVAGYAHDIELLQRANPRLKEIPSVGSGSNVNIEAILQMKPDLVITWAWQPKVIRFMEEKGVRVIAVYPESIGDLYAVMELLGGLFQRQEKMATARAEMEGLFALVREKAAGYCPEERQKMVYLGGRSNSISCGLGINNDLLGLIGGINPAGAINQRSTLVSLEQIVVWNPEVIFIWGNAGYTAEDIINNPQWRHVRAVRDKRVFKLPRWTTWSPRLALIALWMAAKAHPEDYGDVDLDTAADVLWRKAFGICCESLETS
jgi:iron complex transport system substrate-binding protein